ncbi:hypothetical protein NQ176_g6120 [Zarea fungicola]|uniref:Uncharacterized protein n=1 Tax=Zarea fungicola TaxID=93591 RepID=A0ACC1N600_9HYPO|nr:hypothetical protein NQ176_g6120 [Lecanicillium fungicola]
MSKKALLPHDNNRNSRASAEVEDGGMAGTKLSPVLKALINAPFSKSGPCPAPNAIHDVYARIAQDAAKRKLGTRPPHSSQSLAPY